MKLSEQKIGAIGLGQMGGGIASNLAAAGYAVIGYDPDAEAVGRLVASGGKAAENARDVVAGCGVVLTCVEGRVSISLADETLIPNARAGQVFIDHSTVSAPETRRIGRAYAAKGVGYLDAPVSGGARGAAAGTLRIFVGGEKETADRCWPLFEAAGNPEGIVYCGAVGMGQAAKVVQQLTTRFPDVARMEVMAFGLHAGLDLGTVMRALDVTPDSDDRYARLHAAIRDGVTENLSGLFSEWPYYLDEAVARGFRMPMLEAMYEFCKNGEKVSTDVVGRPTPSIWNELMRPSAEDGTTQSGSAT